MSVKIDNPAEAGQQASAEATEEFVEHQTTVCLNCKMQVILLPRTIQTFCYRCGLPVTQPDQAAMYYEVSVKDEGKDEA